MTELMDARAALDMWRKAAAVQVLRLMLQALSGRSPHAWVVALGMAERDLADCGGARTAAGILAAIQRIGALRPMPFHFQNPDCPDCSAKTSTDEDRFLAALQAAAAGPTPALNRHLQILTFSSDIGLLQEVMIQLAKDLSLSPI